MKYIKSFNEKKGERTEKGILVPNKYLTKDKESMKKEIDKFPKNFHLIDEKIYGISKIIFGACS